MGRDFPVFLLSNNLKFNLFIFHFILLFLGLKFFFGSYFERSFSGFPIQKLSPLRLCVPSSPYSQLDRGESDVKQGTQESSFFGHLRVTGSSW